MKKLAIGCFILLTGSGLLAQNKIILQADLGKDKISKHIYGHFAEHLGNCIYNGFYVGDTNKIIPNTDGVRNDIIAALKKIESAEPSLARRLLCGYLSLERWHRSQSQQTIHR